MDEASPENNDTEFKIITLGNPGVGKTSIIQRFVNDEFNPDQLSTLGVSLSFRVLTINKRKLKLKLIDTGGQEKYRAIAKNYFKHADVVLFVFDLNLKVSFESIQYWIDLFNESADGDKIILKYLIGNKCDLPQNVDQGLIDELVEKNKLLYMSTSALTKNQIDEMFEYIAGELYEYSEKNEKNKKGKNTKKAKVLTKTNLDKPTKRRCCD